MSGPGRNYYLWYDLDTKKFTVIGWDYNLTFSGEAAQGPHEQGRMGGRGPTEAELPEGFEPPEGFQPPEGFEPPAADGDGAQPSRGGFGGLGGHKLKERFLASSTFKQVYEDAYRELYQKIYASATAQQSLQRITQVLSTVDGYDEQATASDAQQLKTMIEQRTAALATNEVVKN
jgi:spore coat protein CotH